MSDSGFPSRVVLHIPHDPFVIPDDVRPQILLFDSELILELQRMTDHRTRALFAEPQRDATVVRAPVSHLVVDVERFAEDSREPMALRGMGAVYEVTSHLALLIRSLSAEERAGLMQAWYHPHHERLEAAVAAAIEEHGRCLVIDGHSFPGAALPYEAAGPGFKRPDICIGSDPFYTPKLFERAFVEAFGRHGWHVALNAPFSGALVPASRYRRDPRVFAGMVEVNRDLHLEPSTAVPNADFARIARVVKDCCFEALAALGSPQAPLDASSC